MGHLSHSSIKWALLSVSKNDLDGVTEHLIHDGCLPKLYVTKAAAMEDRKYYVELFKKNPYLRLEPHGWRLPKPVKVKITVIT